MLPTYCAFFVVPGILNTEYYPLTIPGALGELRDFLYKQHKFPYKTISAMGILYSFLHSCPVYLSPGKEVV